MTTSCAMGRPRTELTARSRKALAGRRGAAPAGVDDRRSPSRKGSRTTVLAPPLEEWSLKVSAKAGPEDDPADLGLPVGPAWSRCATSGGSPDAPDLRRRPGATAISDWPGGRT